jgi:hypothetical protein
VRGCYSLLALLIAIGASPLAAAQGQEQHLQAAVSAEQQPAAERAPATAQPPAAAETPKPAAGPAVERSQLDTFLLRDSKGNLVPVVGMQFEEFEQLWRLKKGLAVPAAPGYVLEGLSIVGSADDRIADLHVTATVRVREEGWVRVPLNMPTAVLRQPPKYDGPGEQFLTYDAELGGYVCWLKGNDAKPHVVTLTVSAAVPKLGDERRLAIGLARATESSLRLTTSEKDVEASLAGGEGIVSTRVRGDRTEISVLGPAGELQLAWRANRDVTSKRPGQIDASGEINVRIESEHRITSDARLRVRGLSGPLESFSVRLPPGMELVPLPATGGFTVTPLATSAGEAAGKKEPPGQVVEVRFDRPAIATTEVILRAQRQPDARAAAPLAPARFEVLGAARQRGTIDFTMDGEWQLDWTEDKSVHRLDLTPDTAAARIVARFEYFQQPCDLELKVSPRPSRVSVEPTHMVYVDSQRIRVETLLKYRFRGARATGLSFELGDWHFDRLTPDALLDVPVESSQNPGQWQVPFRAGAAPPTELELKLEAHQILPPKAERLSLTFPRPRADVVAPAIVAIVAADNVELAPQSAELVGLSPDLSSVRAPGRQQSPLVYRDLGGGEAAAFVAGMRTLARATAASGRATVRVDRQQVQVEQRLDYRVVHEPQRVFTLVTPRELASGGSLQLSLDGQPLAVMAAEGSAAANSALARLQFSTPADQIGSFQVLVRYALPLRWDGQKPLPLALPLVLPLDEGEDQFEGQQLEFLLAEGLQIEPDGEAEDATQPTPIGGEATDVYQWTNPPSVSRWTIQASQASEFAPTAVSQMWVQTWLTPESRQERVALRLNTLQPAVRVKLPKGVRQSSVLTAIDGKEIQRTNRMPGVIAVNLPASARGHECVLEVCYAVDFTGQPMGLLVEELRAAEIVEAGAPRRVYWQLVFPEDQHLILPPGDMAVEMTWSKQGRFVARRPVMDQRQLEAWIDATPQDPPPLGVNEYLFGTLGRWPTLQVRSASRRLIVPVASGFVLAVGLLLVHVRRLRSPGVLLAAAIVLAAVALAAPDFAMLAGQGAMLGLAVAIVAAGWAWFASGHPVPRSSVMSSTIRPRESASTQPPASRPDRSSRISSTAAGGAPVMEARP